MAKVLKLTFSTEEEGKNKVINIAAPKEDLTEDAVKTAMQTVVDQGAIGTRYGNLVAPLKAAYYENDTLEVFNTVA